MTDGSKPKSANIEEHKATLKRVFEGSPFVGNLGIVIDELKIDEAVLRMPWADRLARNLNVLHGGAVATLIDTAGGVAAFSDFEKIDSLNAATINMLINYLSAGAPNTDVIARARVVKRGRSIVVIDVEVEDAAGKLIASGTVTYKMGSKVGARGKE